MAGMRETPSVPKTIPPDNRRQQLQEDGQQRRVRLRGPALGRRHEQAARQLRSEQLASVRSVERDHLRRHQRALLRPIVIAPINSPGAQMTGCWPVSSAGLQQNRFRFQ